MLLCCPFLDQVCEFFQASICDVDSSVAKRIPEVLGRGFFSILDMRSYA